MSLGQVRDCFQCMSEEAYIRDDVRVVFTGRKMYLMLRCRGYKLRSSRQIELLPLFFSVRVLASHAMGMMKSFLVCGVRCEKSIRNVGA